MTSEPKPFNPFEPGFAEDPYPQFAELSATNPVQQTPLGLWALFRYDDAVGLLRDPRLSVEDRSVVGANPRAELREQILGDRPQRGTHQILNLDPPDHTRLRKLVQQVFTPRTVEQLAPRVQAMVDDALDAVVVERGSEMDVIGDLAFPLPFRVISEMLGMPDVGGGAAARLGAHAHARPRAAAGDPAPWTRSSPPPTTSSSTCSTPSSGSARIRPTTCCPR